MSVEIPANWTPQDVKLYIEVSEQRSNTISYDNEQRANTISYDNDSDSDFREVPGLQIARIITTLVRQHNEDAPYLLR